MWLGALDPQDRPDHVGPRESTINLTQLTFRARSGLDEIRGQKFFTRAEIIRWANDAKDKAFHLIGMNREDHFLRQMRSTDAAETIFGISYNPSALAFVSGTARYTLPPDLWALKRIRCITEGKRQILFTKRDEADPAMINLLVEGEEQSTATTWRYFWDIVGDRTLSLAPAPREALDIEIEYIAIPPDMIEYATGTCATTAGQTGVTFVGTALLSSGIVAGDEFIVSAAVTDAPTTIDPSRQYPVVRSVDTDTTLTLELGHPTTNAAGTVYLLSSRCRIPRPYHEGLVLYASARGKFKDRHGDKLLWEGIAKACFGDLSAGTAVRQTADVEVVEAYLDGYE